MKKNYLGFRVGNNWYGVDVDNVIEVLHLLAINELPVASPDVLGLMTVRDVVIPVIDLRKRFKLPNPIFSLTTPIITVRLSKGAVGLVVDDVDNVEAITPEQIVAYEGTESAYVTGIAKLPGRLLLLLNPEPVAANAWHLEFV